MWIKFDSFLDKPQFTIVVLEPEYSAMPCIARFSVLSNGIDHVTVTEDKEPLSSTRKSFEELCRLSVGTWEKKVFPQNSSLRLIIACTW